MHLLRFKTVFISFQIRALALHQVLEQQVKTEWHAQMAKPDIAILTKYVTQLKLSFTVNGATDAKSQVIFDAYNPFWRCKYYSKYTPCLFTFQNSLIIECYNDDDCIGDSDTCSSNSCHCGSNDKCPKTEGCSNGECKGM